MRIQEVEALVGITRKNIRFYEAEGLLSPRRNSENGYRDYSDQDVSSLRQIKLLRKLAVPLDEIRQMQTGACSLAEGMHRHLSQLEQQQKDLEQAVRLCQALKDVAQPLEALDCNRYLAQMDALEEEGVTFINIQKQDKRKKYVAPLVVSALMFMLMGGVIALLAWAYATDPAAAPPLAVVVVFALMPLAVIVGVVIALVQRFHEIQGGEEDAAGKY